MDIALIGLVHYAIINPLEKRAYPYPSETAKDMKKAANSFAIDYNIVTKKKT